MKKNKFGFTLTEVLLVIVIVGVILALAVHTFNSLKASYTSLSYFTTKNVELMVRTLFLEKYARENTVLCKKQDGSIVSVLKPDGVDILNDVPYCSQIHGSGASGSAGGNKVCYSLVDINNVSGSTDCGNLYSVNYDSQYNNEPYIDGIEENRDPTFRTTNGQRYYLSGSTYSSSISQDFGFRVLAVDLNGSKHPNTYDDESSSPPDIVNFLIMDNGDVYPLGVLADNITETSGNSNKVKKIRYIASSVKGYCRRGDERSDCESVITSAAYIPNECRISGNANASKCGFVDQSLSVMTYRQAYCATKGLDVDNGSLSYNSYCSPVVSACMADSSLEYCKYMFRCPPSEYSGRYDSCKIENIKPIFRFNFD